MQRSASEVSVVNDGSAGQEGGDRARTRGGARAVAIAPSILAADFRRLGEQVSDALATGVRRIHIDVMDGRFVPNISMGPLVVEALRPLAEPYGAVLEVHLMIVEPDRYLADFHRAGARAMTVHVEACPHLHRTVHAIRALDSQPGVGLNPATPLGTLEEILPEIDVALVMSVNPGFGGQKFIPSSIDKVARLRAMLIARELDRIDIEVDGGVSADNIAPLAEAGMTIAVAGSTVFNARATVADSVSLLRSSCAAHGFATR
jgi:ribulose-phosphate 3-epimerase